MLDEIVGEAKRLEDAGAALLNFTNSGPIVGAAVAQAVSIPVVGGFGGGPWLDGRVRMVTAAIGYSADATGLPPDTYANVARIAHDAIVAYADDVRSITPDRGRTCGDEHVNGGGRRHRHPLRGGGIGSAAVDVLAGWLQRHARRLGNARPVSTHPHAGPAARTVHLHHLRQTRVGPLRWSGGTGALDRTT